jgi:hypothetical protein
VRKKMEKEKKKYDIERSSWRVKSCEGDHQRDDIGNNPVGDLLFYLASMVKEECIQRIVQPPELVARILRDRVCFVPDEAWDELGFPRGPVEGIPTD